LTRGAINGKRGDMKFTPTPLRGALIIDIEPIADDSYLYCARQAAEHGIARTVAQVKLSYNKRKGTVRGMHYQVPPAAETKLVRCTRGAVWDVIVDLRPGSPTYLKNFGIELSAENHRTLHVPALFAHGYQALTDDAEVTYQVDEFYAPQHERGLRYDDPRLGLTWPLPVSVISPKDASWPLVAPHGAPELA
jgi:dTDP-4-dehydrorhamnose 3,5-epimerase